MYSTRTKQNARFTIRTHADDPAIPAGEARLEVQAGPGRVWTCYRLDSAEVRKLADILLALSKNGGRAVFEPSAAPQVRRP